MYGLAVNLIVRVSGHPWIINEIDEFISLSDGMFHLFNNEFRAR